MALSRLWRPSYSFIVLGLMLVALLSACGSNTSTANTSTTAPTTNQQAAVPPTTATATALAKMVSLIGQPSAKIVSGTTFEVVGTLKNGDSKQHDIYVKVALLDATGKIIASTIHNVDNVAGGATVSYNIQGTTPQPTWSKVEVTVDKVTENVDGSGSD
ncbi:MAG: FxLYD domain-containing protein [Ktedonobacteraceae bacterium]